ncbi:MAG: hypothetical protein KC964_19475 [Candidatus Omnitrophica bacterium]|nr:hypothetical protein [Candidatus Omnitrophota bacterium]
MKEGIEAYRDFRYSDSLKMLDRYLRDTQAPLHGRVEALVYGGASAWMLGDEGRARAFFQNVRSLDPWYRIDPDEFDPDIMGCFP